MDTDFGSFADKASLKQNTQANWHGHCMVAYEYYAWRCDVELFNKRSHRTWEWRDRKHPDEPNMKMQNEKQNTIKSSKSICRYFAGILRVFCGYSAESTDYVFLAPFCFEVARVLREGMVEGGMAGMRA